MHPKENPSLFDVIFPPFGGSMWRLCQIMIRGCGFHGDLTQKHGDTMVRSYWNIMLYIYRHEYYSYSMLFQYNTLH